MRLERWRRQGRWAAWLALASLHVGLALLFLTDRTPNTNAARTGFPLDDTWIHLVYGRSVAHSGMPAYNDGQLEAGFTSPVWMLVCALAHAVGRLPSLDVVISLKMLCVLSAILMTLGAHELTLAQTGSALGALLAGLLCALAPPLAFSQVSGMEVCLTAAFSLWAALALHRERYASAGALIAAAVWTRPELLLLWGLAAGLCLGAWRETVLTRRRGAYLKVVLPTVFAVVLWGGFCVVATGRPLPNTFYGKFSAGRIDGVLMILSEVVWPQPANFLGAGLILLVIGIPAFARGGVSRLLVASWPWVFFVGVAMSRSMPPGKSIYFYWVRYALPALPFFFVLIGAGWSVLWGSGSALDGRSGWRWVRRIAATGLAVMALVMHPAPLREQSRRFAWNCQNLNEVQVRLGEWVAANTQPDATVVVNDAGAIRYFGNRRTIDLIGLNYHELAHDLDARRRIYSSAAEMREFMRRHDAQYLIVFPTWFPHVFGDPASKRVFHVETVAVSENYTVAPAAAQDRMFVFSVW